MLTFAQLSETAKATARQAERENICTYEWWETVFDDAAQAAAMMGITIHPRYVKTIGGGLKPEWQINFTGFYSQGGGANFRGEWTPVKDPLASLNRVMSFAPDDTRLHKIAFELALISERCAQVSAITKVEIVPYGGYSNSAWAEFEVFEANTPFLEEWDEFQTAVWEALRTRFRLHFDEFEADISAAIRPFMDWIFARLCDEHEYLTSDEVIDEGLSDLHFTDAGMIIQPTSYGDQPC